LPVGWALAVCEGRNQNQFLTTGDPKLIQHFAMTATSGNPFSAGGDRPSAG
jgi:hypothetical protein